MARSWEQELEKNFKKALETGYTRDEARKWAKRETADDWKIRKEAADLLARKGRR